MNTRQSTHLQRRFLVALTLAVLAIPAQADRSDAIEQRLNQLELNAKLQLDAIRALRKDLQPTRSLSAQPLSQTHKSTLQSQYQRNEAEKYHTLIRERLSHAWIHPYLHGDLRKYSATVEINLLPTGEITHSRIIHSSGNRAYDNSVTKAAETLSRYPIPSDRDLFNQYFRTFQVTFTPERMH